MTQKPETMAWEVEVLEDAAGWRDALPGCRDVVRRAAQAALSGEARVPAQAELCVVLTDDGRQRELNRRFRGIDKPTNVLSFPASEPGGSPGGPPDLLGDVVLALETCGREAAEQGKSLSDHVSHLTVHGVLHLLGFDHENDGEAELMERHECRILAGLGIPDPYAAEAGGRGTSP
jgi:probable rRNA maturation factor